MNEKHTETLEEIKILIVKLRNEGKSFEQKQRKQQIVIMEL